MNSSNNWSTVAPSEPPSLDFYDCRVRLKFQSYPPDYGYYLCGPILAALIAVGLVGNSCCLIVFMKSRPTTALTFYTIPLCLCDFAVLIGSFFMENLPHLLYGRMRTYGPYVKFYPYLNFFSNFAYTSCVWLVVFLSVERYFALCYPLKHRIYDARRRSILISVCCLVAAAAYNVCRYFELHVFTCLELGTSEPIDLLTQAEFRTRWAYWVAYRIILGPLLFSLGPFLLLCVLSARIWSEVRRSGRLMATSSEELGGPGGGVGGGGEQTSMLIDRSISCNKRGIRRTMSSMRKPQLQYRQSNASSIQSSQYGGSTASGGGTGGANGGAAANKQKRVLTCTLLCVILKFLFCHTLPAVIDICETVMDEDEFHTPLLDNLVSTSTFLVVANSSVSIFVYSWCSGAFRRQIKALLLRRQTVVNEALRRLVYLWWFDSGREGNGHAPPVAV